ncbi:MULTISPECIES: peroxiredoxin [Acidithrix]|uniref:thioredoxin-dependent peroxiredoxin n=2 Tax=root TaxID=1 RepID=A0A0D8HJ39_9ACTN|nr:MULTISPECIES: peroxiredoxin [Acidithrix]KJF17802.1 putative peroxiredoxin bcp [Acidithrix ferrooxidans]CAG4925314.1 unnamed protein product [Acidithrix sp. C25]
MNVGDLVADFELYDQNEQLFRLSEKLKGGPIVLFFYPAAMTKGCTAESCHFRDLKEEFERAGAQRVGISADKVAKQKEFSNLHDFDYPLLSDVDQVVAEQFGVKRRFGPIPVKRHTFVIGQDQRVLEIFASEFAMNAHADKALEFFRTRQAG